MRESMLVIISVINRVAGQGQYVGQLMFSLESFFRHSLCLNVILFVSLLWRILNCQDVRFLLFTFITCFHGKTEVAVRTVWLGKMNASRTKHTRGRTRHLPTQSLMEWLAWLAPSLEFGSAGFADLHCSLCICFGVHVRFFILFTFLMELSKWGWLWLWVHFLSSLSFEISGQVSKIQRKS